MMHAAIFDRSFGDMCAASALASGFVVCAELWTCLLWNGARDSDGGKKPASTNMSCAA
jgi:hypothetical protein